MTTIELEPKEADEKVETLDEMLEHYQPVENGKGTLIVTKKDLGFVMKVADTASVIVPKDTSLLVLHMFENIKSKERSILFLTGEQMCMYVTENYDDDFTTLRDGTDTDKFEE